jgi:predicted dienelactone hydrolase
MFKIGFMTGRLDDGRRSNWVDDGPRPIVWSAWYPTDDIAPKSAIFPERETLFADADVVADARPSARRKTYPVVLLSHGTGGSAAALGWLGRRLAAAGFVAFGVDHHGNTASQPYRPEGFLCWWERPRDLTVLLDHQVADGRFAGRLDLQRVHAAGFSLGGHTVLALLGAITRMQLFADWAKTVRLSEGPREFPDLGSQADILHETSAVFRRSWARQSDCYRDLRIRAGLLCAPAPTVRGLTVDSLESIGMPVVIAAVGADLEAPTEHGGDWLHRHLPDSRLERLDPGAGHYVFLEKCSQWGRVQRPHLCIDAPGIDRGAIHDRTAALAIALFGSA